MPNLYISVNCDVDLKSLASDKSDEVLSSIRMFTFSYTGHVGTPVDYDILIDDEELPKDFSINLTDCKKNKAHLKIEGVLKAKVKQELYLDFFEDKNPTIKLHSVRTDVYNEMEIDKKNKNNINECSGHKKKPK